MKPTPNYARRALVLAWIGNVAMLITAAATLSAWRAFQMLAAWVTGFAYFGALTVYRQRRELERRKAAAQARAAELARLETQLCNASDDTVRVRLLERLGELECWPLVLALVLQACAGGDLGELELEHDAGAPDAAAELEHDAAGDAAQQSETEGDAAQPDWLTLVHPHCAGAWADRDDSSTRFVAHPDTGLCTFSCRWLEPKCEEPWYGDPRCYPAHEQRLEQVCAELGGLCGELASDGERYCEGAL